MKRFNKTKAIRMIEKFDAQLRELLNEEIKSARSVKTQIVANLNIDNQQNLLVA